ncbi:MAG: HTTM domain-containing protein [Gammaproteobacteria bacterium]|nr:HTTM domain-containing protein [Gammaproteobacteria bacterium]
MSLDNAIRLTEILVGFAFAQQSIEHFTSAPNERRLFIPRLLLAALLIVGYQTAWVTVLLLLLGLAILQRFQGPYNGGADRMSFLILSCLCLVHFAPTQRWQEIAFGYLALQLVLSYFISGWVKIVNPDWRTGRALCDVFQFSAYPVSESLRQWSQSPRLLFSMSWSVILFELLFPLSLLSTTGLIIALLITASFHFANACLFGLNRFFWIWIAAYPSILWFQLRIFTTA